MTDVLKSVIYRNMDLKHPLHDFVDENVAIFTNETDYKEYIQKMEAIEEETKESE